MKKTSIFNLCFVVFSILLTTFLTACTPQSTSVQTRPVTSSPGSGAGGEHSKPIPPPEQIPLPEPAPSPKNYTRIACESQFSPTADLNIFRSDASDRFNFPAVQFFDHNLRIFELYSPQFIQNLTSSNESKNSQSQLIFLAKTQVVPLQYKNQVYLADYESDTRSAQANKIYEFPVIDSSVISALNSHHLPVEHMRTSNSFRNMIVPNVSMTGFDLVEIDSLKIIKSIALDPKNHSIAAIAQDGMHFAFYETIANYKVRIVMSSLNDDKLIALPFATNLNNADMVAVAFSETQVFWTEKTEKETLIRQADIAQVEQAQTLQTIEAKTSSALQIINIQIDGKTNSALVYFIDKSLHFLILGEQSSEKIFSIPKYILDLAPKLTATWPEKIVNMPWSNEILLSLGLNGALLSFDYAKLSDEAWKTIGLIDNSNRCFNPSVIQGATRE